MTDALSDHAYDALSDHAYDAIVLAGGSSRRMGGADKTRLDVAGVPLLDRVLAVVSDAGVSVVVGRQRPTIRTDVHWTLEQPPGGGPAAAVKAGLSLVESPTVVLLAADLPFVTGEVVQRLFVAAAGPRSGAIAVDDAGHPQWLLSAWQTAALRSTDLEAGRSLRQAFTQLSPERVVTDSLVTTDCDTPEDLRRARELA